MFLLELMFFWGVTRLVILQDIGGNVVHERDSIKSRDVQIICELVKTLWICLSAPMHLTCQWYLEVGWSQVWKLGDASFDNVNHGEVDLTPSSRKENMRWTSRCYKGHTSDSMVVLGLTTLELINYLLRPRHLWTLLVICWSVLSLYCYAL